MKYRICLILLLVCGTASACAARGGGVAIGLGYPLGAGVLIYADPVVIAGPSYSGVLVTVPARSSQQPERSPQPGQPQPPARPPRTEASDAPWNEFDKLYRSPLANYRGAPLR